MHERKTHEKVMKDKLTFWIDAAFMTFSCFLPDTDHYHNDIPQKLPPG
jgi:hypothetical protein